MKHGTHDNAILYLGSEWRWAYSITLRLLYLRGKSPRRPEDKTVGSCPRIGRYGEGTYLCQESNLGLQKPQLKEYIIDTILVSNVQIYSMQKTATIK
jgi:hypothetical protein